MPLTSADFAAIWLTLQLASLTTVILLIVGTPIALWLAHTRSRMRGPDGAIVALRGTPQLTEVTGVFAVSFSEPGACSRETARWIVEEMARRGGH